MYTAGSICLRTFQPITEMHSRSSQLSYLARCEFNACIPYYVSVAAVFPSVILWWFWSHPV